MNVTITHPTQRPNFTVVWVDGCGLAFSYRTLIGINFGDGEGWRVRRNEWGPTTGKHLNDLNDDHSKRLESDAFLALVNTVSITAQIPEPELLPDLGAQ